MNYTAPLVIFSFVAYLLRGYDCFQNRHTYTLHSNKYMKLPGMNRKSQSYSLTSSSDIDISSQVFCNVELNLAYTEAVGFDMDFTLAQYNTKYEEMVFNQAKEMLCKTMPELDGISSSSLAYSTNTICRGLVVDKQRGNILKIDRHKSVRKAVHGSIELTTEQRKAIYNKEIFSFSEDNFVNIDTVHLAIEAMLFIQLVDLQRTTAALQAYAFHDLYSEVREAMERCHREGTITRTVATNPELYISRDVDLVSMLVQLRQAGKKLFLLTNSQWQYADAVMDFLVQNEDNQLEGLDWRTLFDVVIVGASKPAFLTDHALNLFRVNRDGKLQNIEHREAVHYLPTRTTSISSSSSSSSTSSSSPQLSRAEERVFHGGCWLDLHRMLGVSHGDKVLYVGDQMFTDILRSKRTLGWRTCLIVPELAEELRIAQQERGLSAEILQRRKEQCAQDEAVDRCCELLKQLQQEEGEDKEEVRALLSEAQSKADQIKEEVRRLNLAYDQKFHSQWGQLFKAGLHDSRFGKQVRNYACLYTSKASNLRNFSPTRTFRPVQDFLDVQESLHSTSIV